MIRSLRRRELSVIVCAMLTAGCGGRGERSAQIAGSAGSAGPTGAIRRGALDPHMNPGFRGPADMGLGTKVKRDGPDGGG